MIRFTEIKNADAAGNYYGKTDGKLDDYFPALVKDLDPNKRLNLAALPVEGKLKGSDLLGETTNGKILTQLDKMLDVRSKRELLEKKVESSAYYYQKVPKTRAQLNKKAGDEAPPVDLTQLGLQQ